MAVILRPHFLLSNDIVGYCSRHFPDTSVLSGSIQLSAGRSVLSGLWIQTASSLLLWLGSTASRCFSYLPGQLDICTQILPCGADPCGTDPWVFAFHILHFGGANAPPYHSVDVFMDVLSGIVFGADGTLGGMEAPIVIWITGNAPWIARSRSCFPA